MKRSTVITLITIFLSNYLVSAQSYKLVSYIEFSSRIHYFSPNKPQEPRIAGSDYLVQIPKNEIVSLTLENSKNSVIFDGKTYILSEKQTTLLKRGIPVVIEKQFELSLFSDAQNRSVAILFVRDAKSRDKALLRMLNLKLIKTKENK